MLSNQGIYGMLFLTKIKLSTLGFWCLGSRMELEDFCYYFQMLFVCCENPSFIDRDVDCRWKYRIYEGSWVAGVSSGGDLSECESCSSIDPPARPRHQSSSAHISHFL